MRADGRSGWRKPVVKVFALAAVTTVIVTGVLCRDSLIDSWHLWRFESSDLGVQKRAAEKLIERRSVRAVPVFLKHSLGKDRTAGEDFIRPLLGALERPEVEVLARLTANEDPAVVIQLSELHQGTASPKAPFTPVYRTALRSSNPDLRRWAAEELSRLGPEACEAESDLRVALNDPSELVRLWAGIALNAAELKQ